MQPEKDITKVEIRGVSIRNFVWIMSGILGIAISGMIAYFNIIRKLDGLGAIQTNISVIQTRVESNSVDLRNLQQHTIPSLDNRMSIMEEKMKDKVFIKDVP